MAEALLFSISGSVAAQATRSLGSPVLEELGMLWGLKGELQKLQNTVSAIQAKLLDAEEKQAAVDNAVRHWLARIEDVVYEADDLLDDFSTEGLLREMMTPDKKAKKVRLSFSISNQLYYGLKLGHKIKAIREKLGAIKDDKVFLLLENRTEEKIGVSSNKKPGEVGMDNLIKEIGKVIDGKKYFLVLDDVWNEDDIKKWDDLEKLLLCGARGSRVLVTTRSEKQMVFRNRTEPESSTIIAIGKEIVKECQGVPLVIRTIGRLLHSKESEKGWSSFLTNELPRVKGKHILETLKLSYHHLPSHLKHCFAYCSIFPKDCVIKKSMLINLWIAQGFIKAIGQNQCLEDIANDYFMELLWRSFFQEAQTDDFGDIGYCKMHDFMHDLAIKVSGSSFTTFDSENKLLDESKTRHVAIGDIDFLSAVTTHLEIDGCAALTCMPRGLGQLTNLMTLSVFVVNSGGGVAGNRGGLDELNGLNSLRGKLEIKGLVKGKDVASGCKATNLKDKRHLHTLVLEWTDIYDENVVCDETQFDGLEPHPNLKDLVLFISGGVRLPNWLLSLTNLVNLRLSCCKNLKYLPLLSQLPSLNRLTLRYLDELEYILDINMVSASSSSIPIPYFPSLKEMEILSCPKLKGWCKRTTMMANVVAIESSRLTAILDWIHNWTSLEEFTIWGCPSLTSLPKGMRRLTSSRKLRIVDCQFYCKDAKET
ncbi:putative disease resistance protein RGA4 [Morella rubra]|uniref:Putative disease resistance protein RGA4 n=1 Tax=Morella rubra TaxID=262757 RepID=A0A6A1WR56_9ROSI|nr:putative disease resistance protein RGA4 [Morella rubra]